VISHAYLTMKTMTDPMPETVSFLPIPAISRRIGSAVLLVSEGSWKGIDGGNCGFEC